MVIKSYRDLDVWQKAMGLVTEMYEVTDRFPKSEMYSLSSQMQRAAVSIPSNISEGYGRGSTSDYARFVSIAIGSAFELQTQIEISYNLRYIDSVTFQRLNDSVETIQRMLRGLGKSIKNSSY